MTKGGAGRGAAVRGGRGAGRGGGAARRGPPHARHFDRSRPASAPYPVISTGAGAVRRRRSGETSCGRGDRRNDEGGSEVSPLRASRSGRNDGGVGGSGDAAPRSTPSCPAPGTSPGGSGHPRRGGPWMAGTSPAMTKGEAGRGRGRRGRRGPGGEVARRGPPPHARHFDRSRAPARPTPSFRPEPRLRLRGGAVMPGPRNESGGFRASPAARPVDGRNESGHDGGRPREVSPLRASRSGRNDGGVGGSDAAPLHPVMPGPRNESGGFRASPAGRPVDGRNESGHDERGGGAGGAAVAAGAGRAGRRCGAARSPPPPRHFDRSRAPARPTPSFRPEPARQGRRSGETSCGRGQAGRGFSAPRFALRSK